MFCLLTFPWILDFPDTCIYIIGLILIVLILPSINYLEFVTVFIGQKFALKFGKQENITFLS